MLFDTPQAAIEAVQVVQQGRAVGQDVGGIALCATISKDLGVAPLEVNQPAFWVASMLLETVEDPFAQAHGVRNDLRFVDESLGQRQGRIRGFGRQK